MDLTPIFQSAGAQYGVDPTILRALAMKESSMNPAAVNPASGTQGIMQFTPATAKAYGIDPMDPAQAIPAAARMFSENLKRFDGSVPDAVAAHFAGPNQQLWGPKTQQYVGQVAGIFNQLKQGQPTMATPQPNASADPLLSMAQAIQNGSAPGPSGQHPNAAPPGDPLMAMAQQIQAGKMPIPVPQNQANTPQGNNLANDLAAGGSSPNTLSELGQVASGAAHGIGSMANNAANFVERQAARIGIFPQTAARDTATQAAADQQFAQNASPGQKASAIVAPMLVPMSGAMAPGNAIRAGITALPRMGGTIGNLIGAGVGNAVNGALMATGAPINPNQPAGPQDVQHLGMGAALGVALPAAFGAAKGTATGIYNAVRPMLNPADYVGEQFANQIGDQAANIANNIRNAPEIVPGSMPTTAQVGQNPILVATEKAQANNSPDFKIALATREAQNNGARWNALNDVAQSPLDLTNAEAARDTAVQTLYNTAKQQDYPVDAPLTTIMNRPSMQAAMSRAQQLADEKGAGPIMQTVRVPNSMGGSPGTSTTLTGTGAHYVKLAFDDMLNPQSQSGFVGNSQGALKDTRSAFMAWLESKSPEYQQARQTYMSMSPPINTMEAGQQMVDKLGNRNLNSFGAPQLTSQSYQTALAQALKKQPFGIDPDAEQQLNNIASDLQRSTVSSGLTSPGSDTAYNAAANGWLARNLYGPNFQGASGLGKAIGALGAAATGHPMVGLGILGGGNKLGQMVGDKLNAQVNDLLLNPSAFLPYLNARAAGPIYGPQQALAAALRRNVGPALIGGIARNSFVNSSH